jgi:ABC-type nitrate/sulfonate/bicarbonate transport system substrate-binding protein
LEAVRLSVLRGVCQIPAYVADAKGFFEDEGVAAVLNVEATAWMVPEKLVAGASQFGVIPWTRVAADSERLVVVCGSGREEAAIVVRAGVALSDVRSVTVPLRGGIKDLTAMALVESLGWTDVEVRRQPSGDGAIIALFGQGSDAASMVEPYATMLEALGVGRAVRTTGDVWPGAPGCSLATTKRLRDRDPGVVEAVVRAFTRGARFVDESPMEAAEIAAQRIGIHERFIAKALETNRPDVDAIRSGHAVEQVLALMVDLDYIPGVPQDFIDLSFLDRVAETAASAS